MSGEFLDVECQHHHPINVTQRYVGKNNDLVFVHIQSRKCDVYMYFKNIATVIYTRTTTATNSFSLDYGTEFKYHIESLTPENMDEKIKLLLAFS